MTRKDWPRKIRELGDALAVLTLAEGAQLAEYLAEAHGVRSAAQGNLLEPMRETLTSLATGATATLVSVVYEGLADPGRKIAVIKVLREITGCGLAEGKDISERPPRVLQQRIAAAEGQASKRKLEEAGAKVSLRPEA